MVRKLETFVYILLEERVYIQMQVNNLKTPTKFFILESKCDSQGQYGDLNLWKISNLSYANELGNVVSWTAMISGFLQNDEKRWMYIGK